jgi:hypothetical protein
MILFLVGVGMLVFVFMHAFQMFSLKPSDALGLRFTGDPKKDPLLAEIGFRFGWIFVQIGLLLIMAFAASLISQKGINLYFSALQGLPIEPSKRDRNAPPAPSATIQAEPHGEAS